MQLATSQSIKCSTRRSMCAFLALLSYSHMVSLFFSITPPPKFCPKVTFQHFTEFCQTKCVTPHSTAQWLKATDRPSSKYTKLSFHICRKKIFIIPFFTKGVVRIKYMMTVKSVKHTAWYTASAQ